MCTEKRYIIFSLILLTLTSCTGIESIRNTLSPEVLVIQKKESKPVPEKKIVIIKPKVNHKIIDSKLQARADRKKLRSILKVASKTNTSKVIKYCNKIQRKFVKMGWGKSYCEHYNWIHVRDSVLGTPLIWAVYGDEKLHKEKKFDTTLIFCGVHGDEITPPKFCFDILKHMESIMNEMHPGKEDLKNKLVVIAPLVNPDSFLKKWPTRTNARRVDINRNFPTKDWNRLALKLWKTRYRSDKRRYPGKKSLSEPEVLFQMNLIRRYKPSKIISIHAPLTILDYDGPDLRSAKNKHLEVAKNANQLLIQMSKQAKGYRIKNYPFFPGSLGNWAGNERRIPTYTLELPTSDNRQSKKFWKLFKSSIHSAIIHDFKEKTNVVHVPKNKSDNIN